jgi:hypothetical protein
VQKVCYFLRLRFSKSLGSFRGLFGLLYVKCHVFFFAISLAFGFSVEIKTHRSALAPRRWGFRQSSGHPRLRLWPRVRRMLSPLPLRSARWGLMSSSSVCGMPSLTRPVPSFTALFAVAFAVPRSGSGESSVPALSQPAKAVIRRNCAGALDACEGELFEPFHSLRHGLGFKFKLLCR